MGQKQRDSSAVQLQDSNDLSASPQFKRIGAGQQLKESAVRVAQQIKSFVNYLNPSNPPRPGGRAVLPQTVAAQCGEDKVVVTVKRDLFGIGQLIKASDVSLGSCGVTRQDDATQSVIFEARLQECGSTLMVLL
ncbi:Zona pellucida sperm-binding protein 3 [Acipenser ruthenus]|uniref:Zona pellucida sperm-binding protein 3 n=1 Tax=Acipenser ruthenus TaxID=7906 RepID=A0A444UZV6_ACIRT|nr:Zona pellucida sperm-binding protein 3 [Acipenser ruthenus]